MFGPGECGHLYSMKTIVLATDFAEGADQAADYALSLTQQLHARLIIVHAYAQRTDVPAGINPIPTQLEQLRKRLARRSKNKVAISVLAMYGEPRACIDEVVAGQQADLLIMALADDRPYTARFLGSLPTDMIPQTSVSMLILPPGVHYKAVKTVVLALDLSEPVNAVLLGHAKEFVQQAGPVSLLSAWTTTPMHNSRKPLRGFGSCSMGCRTRSVSGRETTSPPPSTTIWPRTRPI